MSPQREFDFARMRSTMPFFAGTFYEGFLISGFLWGFLFHLILPMIGLTIDILQWLIVTLTIGLIMQCILFGLKKRRYRTPVTNLEILTLYEEVKLDLGKGQGIELWTRNIDRAIFLSTVNPLFKAILFSESTIADILEKPTKGKIVLAREILMMERLSPLSRMVLGLLGFTFVSFLESIPITGPFQFIVFPYGPSMFVLIIVIILIGLAIIPVFSSRYDDGIDRIVEDLYGAPPSVAMTEVLTGITVPDEVIEKFKSDDEEGKHSPIRIAAGNGMIAAVITIPIVFFIIYIIASDSLYFLIIALLISSLAGFVVFMLFSATSFIFSLRRRGGKRNTDWDFQNSFADDVQRFLNGHAGFEKVVVRAVKAPSEDQFGIVVTKSKDGYEENTMYSVMPHILKDIHEPDLVGPLILSEIRRDEIENRYNRVSYSIVGISPPFLFISMFLSITLLGSAGFLDTFFQILFIFMIIAVTPLIYMTYWKRKAEIRSDVEIATSCPRFRETLQFLIDKHHTLPYGTTSYRTRLERVNKYLGYPHADKDNGLSHGIG